MLPISLITGNGSIYFNITLHNTKILIYSRLLISPKKSQKIFAQKFCTSEKTA